MATYRATVKSIEGVTIQIVGIPQWVIDYKSYCEEKERQGLSVLSIGDWAKETKCQAVLDLAASIPAEPSMPVYKFTVKDAVKVLTINHMTFSQWKAAVDVAVMRHVGLGVDDLPDCCYADWHADGMTPEQAAGKAIKAAKEDMGY